MHEGKNRICQVTLRRAIVVQRLNRVVLRGAAKTGKLG